MIIDNIKILLVEDHPLYREALANELQQYFPMPAVLQVGTMAEAFAAIHGHDGFNLVILDMHLPDGGGMQGLLAILQLIAPVPVAVISANESRDMHEVALQMGAAVVIGKSATAQEIRQAIVRLLDLEIAGMNAVADFTTASSPVKPVLFSSRQQQVLHLLAQGKSNKEIAVLMGLADTTVRDHVTEILRRLGVSNRTEAVIKAQKLGFVR